MTQQTLAVPARRAGDFWIYWTGQTISLIGSALTNFALPLLVFKLSGSALDLGLTSTATWTPSLFFGLFIGAWVDRVNPNGLMIGLDLAHAVVLTVLSGFHCSDTCRSGGSTVPHETFRRQAHGCHPPVPEKSAPLAAVARFLERPQGAKRRLLRLGETPDVGDIESLVWPIAPQRLQMLATVQVPEENSTIITAAGEPAAIRTHLEPLYRSSMPLLHAHAVPTVNIPPT